MLILASICFIGTITNFISAIVFIKIGFKQKLFKWMFICSISNTLYLFLSCIAFLIDNYDHVISQYYYFILFKLISIYLSSIFGFLNILIEITICVKRYLIISNKEPWTFCKFIKIKFMFYFLVGSLVNLPVLFNLNIKTVATNQNLTSNANTLSRYEIAFSEIGRSNLAKTGSFFLFVLRFIILLAVLLILNIFTIYKYRKQFNKKRKLKILNINSGKLEFYTSKARCVFT